jgi:hypothetical protein
MSNGGSRRTVSLSRVLLVGRLCPPAFAVLLLILWAAPSVAQVPAPAIRIGERVRLSAPVFELSKATAVVARRNVDSLTLALRGRSQHLALPWIDISGLEVREQRSRRQGALSRGRWGLGIGVLLAVVSLATPTPEGEDFSEPLLALEAVVDGALIGALVGVIAPGSRWRPIAVPDAREAVRVADLEEAAAPVVPRVEAPAVLRDSAPSAVLPTSVPGRDGLSLVELTTGINTPQLPGAQFPGLTASLAVNVIQSQQYGGALVGEFDNSYLRDALMGGARVFVRSAPLSSQRATFTFFGQTVAGQVRGERSGVVESNGGFGIQSGVGLQYGADVGAAHLQVDYRSVPGGYVDDDRVSGRHIASLSGMRVFVGGTFRLVRR